MTTALIVVDVQNDFAHPVGSLSLAGGENVVHQVNRLQLYYDSIVYTKDFHPPKTAHFDQWPEHCVENTWGSDFHAALDVRSGANVVLKGTNEDEDGYSGFSVKHLDGTYGLTELDNVLREMNVDEVHIVGLALDVCVKDTALDALKLGYRTVVLRDATAPVTPEGGDEAVRELDAAGVIVR